MSVAPEQLVGSQVGRYRLERILGEGGMGCVYLGVDVERQSRVAIKVLSMQTPDSIQRFLAEARAVSLISHFNIVNLVDLSELPDGRPYMVMELVEGQSLRDAAPTATLADIAKVCCEVLSALEAAHAIGIVHRDLKPDNIMVTRAGHAKVLDFGVAKLAPGVGGGLTPRTKDGLTMGTPAYMAPEQVTGGAIDARTDVYTMGVVLFEVLTGQRPFSGGTDLEIMRAHRDRLPPRPRALVPSMPGAVEHVILRALAKDPAKRFQRASEMATALADAASGRASTTPPSDEKATVAAKILRPRQPPRSRLPSIIAMVAIVIAAAVVFVVARARRDAHRAPTDVAAPLDAAVDDALPDAATDAVTDAATDAAADAPSDAATDAAADAAIDPPITDPRPAPVMPATLPAPIQRAADYAVDAFDAIAYVDRATKLARELAPDAQLVELQAAPVTEASVVDLTRIKGRVTYRYMSALGAKATAIRDGRPCKVVVVVTRSGVTAKVATDKRCAAKAVSSPRCSLAKIRSRADGAYELEQTKRADLSLVYRGRWIVDIHMEREPVHRVELPDC